MINIFIHQVFLDYFLRTESCSHFPVKGYQITADTVANSKPSSLLINRTWDSVQGNNVFSLKWLSQTPLSLALPFDSMRRKQQLVTSGYWENYCFLVSKGLVLRPGRWKPLLSWLGRQGEGHWLWRQRDVSSLGPVSELLWYFSHRSFLKTF